MVEIWKDIKGYEGRYKVSNLGNVKSLLGKKERILKSLNHTEGYYKVILYKENIAKNKCIHRLVAEAFIDNPQNKKDINHKDGNKHNNNVSNLEWCTRKENVIHAWKLGLAKVTIRQKENYKRMVKIRTKKMSIQVCQYDLMGNYIKTWESMNEAGRKLHILPSNICSCCKGKLNKTGGYIWRYADEERRTNGYTR